MACKIRFDGRVAREGSRILQRDKLGESVYKMGPEAGYN